MGKYFKENRFLILGQVSALVLAIEAYLWGMHLLAFILASGCFLFHVIAIHAVMSDNDFYREMNYELLDLNKETIRQWEESSKNLNAIIDNLLEEDR